MKGASLSEAMSDLVTLCFVSLSSHLNLESSPGHTCPHLAWFTGSTVRPKPEVRVALIEARGRKPTETKPGVGPAAPTSPVLTAQNTCTGTSRDVTLAAWLPHRIASPGTFLSPLSSWKSQRIYHRTTAKGKETKSKPLAQARPGVIGFQQQEGGLFWSTAMPDKEGNGPLMSFRSVWLDLFPCLGHRVGKQGLQSSLRAPGPPVQRGIV